MQDSLPAGGLRLCREGVEPSGSLRKVSGYISILLSRTSPVARVVYAKRPFAGPKAVLAYLSRYTHRVAISNSRLTALDGAGVTFKWKDYRIKGRDRLETMTLDPAEFIRRFLLHVLPSGFHRIRHYGLFAGTVRRRNIERARQLLAASESAQRSRAGADSDAETLSSARPCPCCGGRMIIVETFEGPRPWRSPSPARIRIDTS
ncbi:MAG: transposase [Planctomycetaceae bacterium]|nr:transposase [Planctomycetaceae bacterium]